MANNEFNLLIKDIDNNKKFSKLRGELHHGITRYDHSMRVAKWTYKICNLFKMKNKDITTRAALLHDFYINEDLNAVNSVKALNVHPSKALENSKKYFEINSIQEDIIVNHMFPCTKKLPKTKEGLLVSGVDKAVSTYEMLRFKASLYAGIYLLFLFEIIRIPK